MSAEPDKFHVGVIDFFSILLPGAVLAFHLQWLVQIGVIRPLFPAPASEATGWAVFLVAAYILGNFIFLLSSVIDIGYDALMARLVPRSTNVALRAAIAIKDFYLQPRQIDPRTINAFQWAKCRLALSHTAALVHVQRFEADSKFFRSLFLVLLAMGITYAHAERPELATASVLLAAASLWRYADQRFKATRQAYWYLITLESNPAKPAEAKDRT